MGIGVSACVSFKELSAGRQEARKPGREGLRTQEGLSKLGRWDVGRLSMLNP